MAEDKDKSLEDETLSNKPDNTSDDWDWDAAVPQTDTANITFDDLHTVEEQKNDSVEEEKVEQTDEKTEEKKNSDDDGRCIVCGKERGNSPSDLYCNECRAKFLRTNYGVGHIILAFVMVIVAALGYFVCTSTVTVSEKLFKAEKYISEKRYNDALDCCTDIFDTTDKLNSGVNAVIKGVSENIQTQDWFTEGASTIRTIMIGYTKTISISNDERSNFINAVDTYFSDKKGSYFSVADLSKPENKDIKEMYDVVKNIDTASEDIENSISSYISAQEDGSYKVDYDKGVKKLDEFKAKNDIEKSLVYYNKFLLAYYGNKDNSVRLDYFDKAYKQAGKYGYMFLPSYIMIAWEYGEYDKVLELSDKAIEYNVNNTSAYYYAVRSYIEKKDLDSADGKCEEMHKTNPEALDYYSTKAEILRRRGKYDDAIEYCRKGIVEGTDAEIYRQQAIAYLLKSDKENALEAIKQSYDIATKDTSGKLSLEEVNTVALICFICEDKDTYEEIENMLKQYGMDFYDNVKKCIKGDITFEDIFMKGSGEIS